MAARRFVDVSEEEINIMKENAIPKSTKEATKFGIILKQLFASGSVNFGEYLHRLRTNTKSEQVIIEHFHVTSLPPYWRERTIHFLSSGK